MISLFLMLQTADPVAQLPAFNPPETQSAKCVGVDDDDRRQSLILESRWVPDERRTVLFVREDSSGTLRANDWLENQNSMYKDSDRKYGLVSRWDDTVFTKRVGDQYARIAIQQTSNSSASILYIVRPYSDRDQTAMRHFRYGVIMLAGRCSLFVEGERRKPGNMPMRHPVP